MRLRRNRLPLVAVLAFILCSGFVCSSSQIHQATVAEHDFKIAVMGFQNVEIAEFQAGHIEAEYHQKIQGYILQVASGGAAITDLLAKSDKAGALQELTSIDGIMQKLLSDGVLGVKNPTTKASLQIALQSVQAIITNIQTMLS